MPGPRNPPVANTVVGGRGGKHLSTRRLVADKGELGEDHSECTSDQQLQPGLVEEDQHRSPHHSTRSANQRIQWKAPPKAEGRGPSESRTRETLTGPEGIPGSSIAVRPKASRTHWTYGRSAGAIQIRNGSRSRASTSSATPPHTKSKDPGGG